MPQQKIISIEKFSYVTALDIKRHYIWNFIFYFDDNRLQNFNFLVVYINVPFPQINCYRW